MKLSIKIPLLIVIFAFFTAVGISYFIYKETEEKMNAQNRGALFALMKNKSSELTTYLNSLEKDLKFFAELNSTKSALENFSKQYKKIDGNAKEELQKLYITENSNPAGQKHKLDYAPDGSKYSEVHKKHHHWIRKFLEEKGYYDVFLINTDGDVVYTVFKELDYATNVKNGEWKDTDLGKAFADAMEGADEDVHFFDFKPYAPSNNVPASFISKKILDDNGEAIGILVFQMPVDNLNAIFTTTDGLGETGEIAMYGADYLMRNNSRFSKAGETTILNRKWEVDHIDESVNEGESDYQVGPNFDGTEVMLAHAPFEWKGSKYAFITTQNIEEFNAPLTELKKQVIRDTAIALIICAVLGYLITIPTSRRLRKLSNSIDKIAAGENVTMEGTNGKDELASIARSVVSINDLGLNMKGIQDAIDKAQGVIEFNLDGTIVEVNQNFLNVVGYSKEEIVGKHHSIFVEESYKNSPEYRQFWDNLNKGIASISEFKRIAKGGKEVWINASYNPILGADGKPKKVVKYATETTAAVKARQEVSDMLVEVKNLAEQAAKGNFAISINSSGKSPAMKELADCMNSINEICNRGLSEINNVMQQLSDGDLTNEINGEYEGMFAEIKESVNNTIGKLKEITSEIKNSARSVSSSASEISSSSGDLSRRTESQASTLEQTAASMEEITGTVTANTKNAREANQFASEAKVVAQEGGEVVKKVVVAMGKITESSTKISDIISVIDEIAFQTNLLALNAAVEAARAGDAGKGFAVVADEVRALAGRSSQASKQIKDLIQQSVNQVKDGSGLVDKAGSTLEKVVDSFNKLAGLIADISNASEEQSTGINEINSAVSQMDATTQENAAMVEESTAAAQTLTELAGDLLKLINFFKSDDEGVYEPRSVKKVASPAKKIVSNNSSANSSAAKPKTKIASKVIAQNMSDGWEEF